MVITYVIALPGKMHFTFSGGAHGINDMNGIGSWRHLSTAFVIVVAVVTKDKMNIENMTVVMINFSCISDAYAFVLFI
jgi:hypothetical protein